MSGIVQYIYLYLPARIIKYWLDEVFSMNRNHLKWKVGSHDDTGAAAISSDYIVKFIVSLFRQRMLGATTSAS